MGVRHTSPIIGLLRSASNDGRARRRRRRRLHSGILSQPAHIACRETNEIKIIDANASAASRARSPHYRTVADAHQLSLSHVQSQLDIGILFRARKSRADQRKLYLSQTRGEQ